MVAFSLESAHKGLSEWLWRATETTLWTCGLGVETGVPISIWQARPLECGPIQGLKLGWPSILRVR